MAGMEKDERLGREMWRISQTGEEAMKVLRPPGHQFTGAEESRTNRLIEAHLRAGRDMDVEAYRTTMNDLVEHSCRSYRRHVADPTSSPHKDQPAATR